MEWTPKQQQEIDLIISMQSALTELSAENLEETCQFFINSEYVSSEHRFTELVRNIMAWSIFHPHLIYLYSSLLLNLYNKVELINKIASDIILSSMTHLIFKNRLAPLEPPPLHVVVQCYNQGIIKHEEIVENLRKCFIEKRSSKKTLSAYFFFFAPEVETFDPELFLKFSRFLYKNSLEKSNHPICAYFDFFKENSWEKLKFFRSYVHCMNPMLKMLLDDDVEALRKMSAHPDFSVNQYLTNNPPLSPFYFINDDPPLICAAAAMNAVQCFKYLLLMNASLSNVSKSNQGIAAYAAMSGNLEILRIVEQNGCDFSGTLHMSATFHHDDMFYWLHESKFNDLLIPSPEKKSVLGQVASSNNVSILMYCLENGLDVNRIDEHNECMLERAAYFGCNEVVKILLWLPNLNINLKTRSPPLCTAAFNGNSEMLNLFLERPETDPNIPNHKEQTPLDLAASSSHYTSFMLLLDHPNIDNQYLTTKPHVAQQVAYQNDRRLLKELLQRVPPQIIIAPGYSNRTALHIAVTLGNIDIVDELLNIPSIDVNVQLASSETALDLAFKHFQVEIANLLISKANAKSSIARIMHKRYSRHKYDLNTLEKETYDAITQYFINEKAKNQDPIDMNKPTKVRDSSNDQERIIGEAEHQQMINEEERGYQKPDIELIGKIFPNNINMNTKGNQPNEEK